MRLIEPGHDLPICAHCTHFCIFGSLTEPDLEQVLPEVQFATFLPRALVHAEGNPADRVHILRSGAVKVYRKHGDGSYQILRLAGPGDVLGLEGLVGPTYTSSAQSLTNLSLCSILVGRFQELLVQHPGVSTRLAKRMVLDQEFLETRIMQLGIKGARGRVATLLVAFWQLQAGKKDKRQSLRLPIARQELAEMVGISPETVSRILTALVKSGAIAIAGRWIDVRNPDLLMEAANGPPRIFRDRCQATS